MFGLFFSLGTHHILDLNGYDHILFIICVTVLYRFKDLKQVIILVTAFTLGHSISLAFASLGYIFIPSNWVEFLIPVTIIISAGFGFFHKDIQKDKNARIFKYISIAVFGLIHGLGFSSYLASLLGAGSSIALPLLAFNLGLELGQILVVLISLFINEIVQRYTRLPRRDWILITSGIVCGVSLEIAINRAMVLF